MKARVGLAHTLPRYDFRVLTTGTTACKKEREYTMNAAECFNIISTDVMTQISEGEVPVLDAQESSIV